MALEGSEGGEAAETKQQSLERRPVGGLTLGDREDDGAEARCREYGSTEVEASPACLLRIGGHDLDCGDCQCCCDRQIDVEDHPPVAELGEDAADEDADCGARDVIGELEQLFEQHGK